MGITLEEKMGTATVTLKRELVSKDYAKVGAYCENIVLPADECTALEGDIANILPKLYDTFMPLDPRHPVPKFTRASEDAGIWNSFSGEYYGEVAGTWALLSVAMDRNMRPDQGHKTTPQFSFWFTAYCKVDSAVAVQEKIWSVVKPILQAYLVTKEA